MVSTFLFRAGSWTLLTSRTKLPATIVEDRKTTAEALKMSLVLWSVWQLQLFRWNEIPEINLDLEKKKKKKLLHFYK